MTRAMEITVWALIVMMALTAAVLVIVMTGISQAQAPTRLVQSNGTWTPYLEKAAQTWRDQGQSLEIVQECPSDRMCVKVVEEDFGKTRWAAKTYTFRPRMEINTFWRQSPIRMESISCHELGHVLGATHTWDPDSCMYPIAGEVVTP